MVVLEIEGQTLEIEVDTGAAVSVINQEVYRKKFGHITMTESDRLLKSYSGHQLETAGEIEVTVTYGDITKKLPLVVVQGNGPALLGRNWMSEITLDWRSIKQVREDTLVDSLKDKYPVFLGTLGKVNGIAAKLIVQETASSKVL